VATVQGAGGGGGTIANTHGGAGEAIKAKVPISSGQITLDVLAGGGGGGLSGVFTGTPSQADALVVAGGGGGGVNDGTTSTQSNGSAGAFTPTKPHAQSTGVTGGAGYGGGGASMSGGAASADGVAFGAGGVCTLANTIPNDIVGFVEVRSLKCRFVPILFLMEDVTSVAQLGQKTNVPYVIHCFAKGTTRRPQIPTSQ